MAKAKRMTYEQQQAERKAAEEQRRQKNAADFRQRIDRARSQRVYDDKLAFVTADAGEKSGTVLYDMVREFERLRGQLRRELERVQETAERSLRSLEQGEDPSYYSSSLLGQTPGEIEHAAAQIKTQARAISYVAYLGGWFVPQVQSKTELEQRRRMLGVSVEQLVAIEGSDPVGWVVKLDGKPLDEEQLTSYEDGETNEAGKARVLRDETAAWIAAARFCGERF
jgi:hypothetical protein